MRNNSYRSIITISIIIIPILFSCATTQQEQVECKDANTCHQLGMTHIQKRDFNQAILHFNKAIELDPTNAVFYGNRGAAYAAKGRNDQAISDWTKALDIDPKYRSAYYNRGRTFCVMKQYDKAISDLDKALEIDPRDTNAYNERGIAYYEKGQYDQGISDFNKAIEINPYHLMALRNLGSKYYWMKKWPEAIDKFLLARDIDPWSLGLEQEVTLTLKQAYPDLEKWVNEKPEDPRSHYYFAYALMYKGDWKKAVDEMEKAIKLDKSNGQFYKGKALFYFSANKPQGAIIALEECVRINPSNWACYNDLGVHYCEIGKSKEGLEIIIKANNIAPDVISIQGNLGAAYAANEDYQKSIAAFKKALSLSGRHDPRIELNLAFSYFKLQEYDMAWRHARRAERMGNPEASKVIRELKRVSKEPE